MRIERGQRVTVLDGLRGLALAAVVVYHVAPSVLPGGFLGVEVFFVLSGYLLTSLLLNEVVRTGRIDRSAYASRRILRIAPAMVLMLLALVVVAPRVAPEDAYRLGKDVLASLAGMTNWHLILDGNSYFTRLGRPPLVRHLWSIAVELQFYLVCPFIVGWVVWRKRLTAMGLILIGIAASAVAMGLLYESPDPSRAYYGTDTRVGALLSGMLLGFLLGARRAPAHLVRRPRRWLGVAGMLALAALAILVVVSNERSRLLYPGGFLATQVATMVAIAAGMKGGRLGAILEKRPLVWLGERSYGIYLWHWPAVALLRPGTDVNLPAFVTAPATVAIAVVLGAVSYRLVELPFMRRRPGHAPRARFSRRLLRPAFSVAVLVPLAILMLRLPTVDPVAASLIAGERVVANQPPPPPNDPATFVLSAAEAPSLAPATPGSPAVAGPGGENPPAEELSITAIGDSVMVGAAPSLQSKLGPGGYIDARLGRQFDEQLRVIRQLGAQGRLGDVLVLHFGNNGPVGAKHVDALMAEVASVPRAQPHVVLVTVRVDKPWQNSVNRTYLEAAQRHPTIKIADWFSHSAGHPEWFASDGTHLKRRGAEKYAELLTSTARSFEVPPAPIAAPTPIAPATQPPAGGGAAPAQGP